jgi:hypothetical protein
MLPPILQALLAFIVALFRTHRSMQLEIPHITAENHVLRAQFDGRRIPITMRNILRPHHLEPAPQRRKAGTSWQQFLRIHWEALAATDFFRVEVAIWHGLVTSYVLVVMELSTCRVPMAGFTRIPPSIISTIRRVKGPG